MAQQACKDYFERFPTVLQKTGQIKNEDRIKFMLTNPTIRKKLDEWLLTGNCAGNANGSDGRSNSNDKSSASTVDPKFAATYGIKIPNKYEKSYELSLQKRKEGNQFYQQQKLDKSLHCYHEALRHSKFTPEGAKDAAICLANRSAVYFELGKYDDAIRDCDLALANRYPENLKIKLILRKANIFLKLRNFNGATEMVEMGKNLMTASAENSDNDADAKSAADSLEKLNNLENEISGACTFSENCGSGVDSLETTGTDKADLESKSKNFEDNPDFANASCSLAIQYSEKSTRFINCCKDVRMGEVIFEEDPFAAILLPEYYEGFCNYCFQELKGYLFPCSNCTQVNYCSAVCSSKAWKEYHRHECQLLELLQSVGVAHLALRVVLTAGAENVLKTLELEDELSNCQNVNVFRKTEPDYSRVFSLISHIGDVQPEDLFQYCLTASLLTNFLKTKTRFFKGISEDQTVKIGGVILRHVCQLICNAHAITSIISDLNDGPVSYSTLEETQLKIATAIYPSVSLTNHSCDPNIACSFKNGKTLIVKSATDLTAGSEVLNCYGPNFRRMDRKTRQQNLLEQYFFDCECLPCGKELAEKSNFVDKFHAYSCRKCNGPVLSDNPDPSFLAECTECHLKQDMKKAVKSVFSSDEFYSKGMEFLKVGQVNEAIQSLLECYNMRMKNLYEYNSDLGEVCDALGRSYAIIGNFYKAAQFVRKSLRHVEGRFGISSIEYAREVTKYVELLNTLGKLDLEGFPSEDLIRKSKFILGVYSPF